MAGPVDYDRAGGMLEAITGLYARVGLAKPAMPIHALRHTFGTVMARRVPLGVLQRLMGHSEIATTMRYVDVNEDDKREAIAAVFGAFGRQGRRNRDDGSVFRREVRVTPMGLEPMFSA